MVETRRSASSSKRKLSSLPIPNGKRSKAAEASSSSSTTSRKNKKPVFYCGICMDSKNESGMFRNTNVCSHMYCKDCICEHVTVTINQRNISNVKCPDPNCKGLIGLEACQNMLPKQVLEKWEAALCESLITQSEKFIYCPFKDCSAMLVDDGGVVVTTSECPYCNRLFCARCRVAWHSGMDCSEFKSLENGERDPQDVMLMNLAKNKKWMRCPSCKFYVERISGCLHISCRCGHHFCYQCGKQNDGRSHTCPHY
uniref:probable E3 ubiquitin-protein ligase ARI9 n=1 Tax=Erigeron canadensis TaxID=72917 RepID=UPI001CB90AFA|nr:probable E3 ubiquitin-protein ligase ARI9 [Erigeron canadensis]